MQREKQSGTWPGIALGRLPVSLLYFPGFESTIYVRTRAKSIHELAEFGAEGALR